MEIIKHQNDSKLVIELKGQLDALTAPELDAELKTALNGVTELIFDFKELDYVSSAGLRVLLTSLERMNAQGTMTIRNVCEDVMEVFDVTGFIDILNIE